MDDFMELADTGLIAQANGWWLDKNSGNRISPEGQILNSEGEQIGMVRFGGNDAGVGDNDSE